MKSIALTLAVLFASMNLVHAAETAKIEETAVLEESVDPAKADAAKADATTEAAQ